jgi:DNA-binding response OmpR family regulator
MERVRDLHWIDLFPEWAPGIRQIARAMGLELRPPIAPVGPASKKIVLFGSTTIDWAGGNLSSEGKSAFLSRTELRLLAILVEHRGQVVNYADLIESAWHATVGDAGFNALAVYIVYLRRSLQTVGLGPALRTVRGVGYALYL